MAKNKSNLSKTVLFIVVLVVIIAAVCLIISLFSYDSVADIKSEDYVGETVKVRGEVKTVVKIGSLSGFTLEDSSGSIPVSSDDLPKEGDKITVKGVLIRDTLFGYYIKSE